MQKPDGTIEKPHSTAQIVRLSGVIVWFRKLQGDYLFFIGTKLWHFTSSLCSVVLLAKLNPS